MQPKLLLVCIARFGLRRSEGAVGWQKCRTVPLRTLGVLLKRRARLNGLVLLATKCDLVPHVHELLQLGVADVT